MISDAAIASTEESESGVKVKSEEQQCMRYFEPHLHNDKPPIPPHRPKTELGRNHHLITEMSGSEYSSASGDQALQTRKPRPQSAAVSYALHKQVRKTSFVSKRHERGHELSE